VLDAHQLVEEQVAPARDIARREHARRSRGAVLVADHAVVEREPGALEPARLGRRDPTTTTSASTRRRRRAHDALDAAVCLDARDADAQRSVTP
jgi:hypothetical protein